MEAISIFIGITLCKLPFSESKQIKTSCATSHAMFCCFDSLNGGLQSVSPMKTEIGLHLEAVADIKKNEYIFNFSTKNGIMLVA